jgi:hypothetical protein
MADLSDVEEALLRAAAAVVYPEGAAAPSVLGHPMRLYRGRPRAPALEADLAAGFAHLTVMPEARMQPAVAHHPDGWEKVDQVAPGLSVEVSGRTATVAGSAHPGQVAGLMVDGMAVVHRTAPGDTPEMVAAVLATYLRVRRVVTVEGASLTVAGQGPMVGRVVADQAMRRQTRRQRQLFRLTAWCATPQRRDALAGAVDAALSAIDFLDLADTTRARLLYRGTAAADAPRLFRRDLFYAVDYATTLHQVQPAMIFGQMRVFPPGGDARGHVS